MYGLQVTPTLRRLFKLVDFLVPCPALLSGLGEVLRQFSGLVPGCLLHPFADKSEGVSIPS